MSEAIYTPELIFNPSWNYTIDEIVELAGVPRDLVEKAGLAGEIACVCVQARAGGKAWNGGKIAAWIRRRGLEVKPSEIVRQTVRPQ